MMKKAWIYFSVIVIIPLLSGCHGNRQGASVQVALRVGVFSPTAASLCQPTSYCGLQDYN